MPYWIPAAEARLKPSFAHHCADHVTDLGTSERSFDRAECVGADAVLVAEESRCGRDRRHAISRRSSRTSPSRRETNIARLLARCARPGTG